jgi:diacylglycerol O-acyltransferase / trehalose O-mycolyltransferase
MRTTVDTSEAASIPLSARVCRPTGLRWRAPHTRTAVLLAVLVVAAAGCASSRAPEAARPSEPLARTVQTKTLGPRMRDLTIDSPALGRTATVRLLLPRHFTTQPNRRWPVLWLLHGCCDTYQSWTRSTDVGALADLDDVLVVMPEAGPVGFTPTGTTAAAAARRAGKPST